MNTESSARFVSKAEAAKPRYRATISDGRTAAQSRPSFEPLALTPTESAIYYSGDWLGAKLPKSATSGMTDAECAAEMCARIRLALSTDERKD